MGGQHLKRKLAGILVLLVFIAVQSVLSTAARAQFYSGGVFTLTCKTSGLNLDNEGSTGTGNAVWQWSGSSTNVNQQWRINSVGSGYYTLVCVKSGLALDNGGSSSDGADATQNTPEGNTNQEWSITSVGGGYYQLVCATSGMALDNSGATSNGGAVYQWSPVSGNTNQEWLIAPVQTGPTPLLFNLTCKTSGQNLDNEGSFSAGNTCWQWGGATGNTNQEWKFVNLGNGYYNIINTSSGMALDSGGGTANGSDVEQNYPTSGDTKQEWSLTNVGGSYYQIICEANGLALDNTGSTTSGVDVWQWAPGSGNTNQEWLITPVQIGANTPFEDIEAESGTLGGGATVVSLTSAPTTEFSSPALEASGHAYVNLGGTGQYVSFVNNTGQSVNYIDVRTSIPDASGGGGITSTLDLYVNGSLRQAVPVSSKQSWEYESSSNYDGSSKTPTSDPHVFWDDAHVFISGAAVTPGQTITLQKDSANSASYYNIDVVDIEDAPAAISQPSNTLSITSYGAVANSTSTDNLTAIQNCINAAQTAGEGVWIPSGVFYYGQNEGGNGNSLNATGITIEGAGMWYSELYQDSPIPSTAVGNSISPTSCTLQNFTIDTDAIGAGIGVGSGGSNNGALQGSGGGLNVKGSNWTLDNLWILHQGAGIWADGTNGMVENCRLMDTWADGINLNNGNGGTNNNEGNNLTAFNNFVRGTGDDALALNDGQNPGAVEMDDVSFLDNTSVGPWWANNMGVYGGENGTIANNYFHDSVKEFGISVGIFSGQDYLETSYIQGNTLVHGGSNGYNEQNGGIAVGQSGTSSAVTSVDIDGNTDIGAMFDGIDFENGGSGLNLFGNTVTSPGRTGIAVNSGMSGSATLTNDTVSGLASGQSAFIDNAPGSNFTVSGSNDSGFTP